MAETGITSNKFEMSRVHYRLDRNYSLQQFGVDDGFEVIHNHARESGLIDHDISADEQTKPTLQYLIPRPLC